MYYFYVIKSIRDGNLYKGVTNNIDKRIKEHNAGKTRSTKSRRPFIMVYCGKFDTKQEAMIKEKYYKSYIGGIKLKALMKE